MAKTVDRVHADHQALSAIADMLRAELTTAQQELQRIRDNDDCAWKATAEKAIAERNEAQAALADYLRKETTDG